jgi:hypothetical protein
MAWKTASKDAVKFVSGVDQQPQLVAAGFGHHGEEGRDPGPVCPVKVRAA